MSDVSTMVRAYYDSAVDPVTASEVLTTLPDAGSSPTRSPIGLPNWAIAVAVAVSVVAVIGAGSMLLGGSYGADIPIAPSEKPIVPVPDPPDDGVITTTVAGRQPMSDKQATVWMDNRWGVLLSVTPPLLAPVPGTYEVTVHGFHSGEQGGVWVTSCPGAHGEVDVNAWQPAEVPGSLESMCALTDDHHVARGDFVDGAFEAMVQIEIDEAAIEEGGVVITTGDMWVPVAGNVLLRIADNPEAPWEQAYNGLNLPRLTNIITYWPPFVQNFNTTYEALNRCDEAYEQAQAGQSGYLNALEQWDDTRRPTPGYEYDRAVAQLIASERWLDDHTCPGRSDFTTVG